MAINLPPMLPEVPSPLRPNYKARPAGKQAAKILTENKVIIHGGGETTSTTVCIIL